MSKTVLILSKRSANEEKFVDGLNKLKPAIDFKLATYEELVIEIDGKSRVYLPENTDVASFDLVYFKSSINNLDMAATISTYLKTRHVKFIDQALSEYRSTSKIYQYVVLADLGFNVPLSLFMLPEKLGLSFELLEARLGLPFILKDCLSNKGYFNYLIDSRKTFRKTLKKVKNSSGQLVAQKCVPNEEDYRILVFGDQIKLIIKRRRANDDTHLNNVSMGGSFTKIDNSKLPKRVRDEAIRSAQALNRQIAGVDFVRDSQDGQWYILEVNDGPQISSGALRQDKRLAVAEYLQLLLDQ